MTSICFILDCNPRYLGGVATYIKNLITFLHKSSHWKNMQITVIYPGKDDKSFRESDINYVEIKTRISSPLGFFEYGKKVAKRLEEQQFDIINSHGLGGGYFGKYIRNKNFRWVHTYHGVTYYFFKNHLLRPIGLEKISAYSLMMLSKHLEMPPIRGADKIICVSNKVKRDIERLYGKRKGCYVIRTGVDTNQFKVIGKELSKRKIGLEKNKIYGLYVGRGGWWTKGLDRAVNLAKEMHKLQDNFRLIVTGPDYKKCKKYLEGNPEALIYIPLLKRKNIHYYYSACDVLLCCSRYEGGAPTLVVSEAMASGCIVACSRDSEQEIIINEKNGLVLNDYGKKGAQKIINLLNNRNKKGRIIKNSLKTINSFSLKNWGNQSLEVLLKK